MVKWLLLSVTLCVVVVVHCIEQKNEEVEDLDERKSKNLREEYKNEEWKAIEATEDWVPRENVEDEQERPLVRRRRIRKRKRRPPPPLFDEYDDYVPPRRRRRKRPQRLDDVSSVWSAMENESDQRPHKRRRVIPMYRERDDEEKIVRPLGATITFEEPNRKNVQYEKVRDPFTALEEVEAKLNKKKQEETAVTTEMPISTDYVTVEDNDNISIESQQIETKAEETTTVKETTTERRIFVPSHPQFYTTFKYKPEIIDKTSTPSFVATTVKGEFGNKIIDIRTKYQLLRPKLKFPVTNAKLKINTTQRPIISTITISPPVTIPENAFKINVDDLLTRYSNEGTIQSSQEEPLRMTIDIEKLVAKTTLATTTVQSTTTGEMTTIKDLSLKNYGKSSSAKEEIMEVLSDKISRQNLARILQLRNMTIEELVEQRERGSSQLHLADIFHNQTKEPEPPSEPYNGMIPFFYNSFISRKPKTLITSRGNSHFTPPTVQEPQEQDDSKDEYTVTNFPTFKIEKSTPPPLSPQLTIWKTLYPSLSEDFLIANKLKQQSTYQRAREILENEVRRIENVENKISDVVKDRLNADVPSFKREEYIDLSSGVKSAIIASFAIIGISILMFLTIFIFFKWSQKQRQRLCYGRSFSCSRFKSPILEDGTKSIKSFMSETLRKKRKYSNMYPHTMSDYTWDHDKKPFQ